MAAISGEELASLHGSAEFGIYDSAVLAKLADTLIRQPDLLLPQRLAQVRQIAFFFEHAGMHPVAVVIEYWVLRWQLLSGDHGGAAVTAAAIAGIAAGEDDLTDPEAIGQRALTDPRDCGAGGSASTAATVCVRRSTLACRRRRIAAGCARWMPRD